MKILRLFIAIITVSFASIPLSAQEAGVARLSYSPDTWIDLHFLLQVQEITAESWQAGAGPEYETGGKSEWTNRFMLRRARVMLNGQVSKNVTFFWESDDLNRGGTNTTSQDGAGTGTRADAGFTQDAYISYKFFEEFQIDFGMILLPFMHHNRQSAASLLGVDYNSTVINIPTSKNWRDTGIEFRGLVSNGLLDYRIGMFQGKTKQINAANQVGQCDNINPDDMPRFTGRIQLNFLEPEDKFFYSGNYLGKKKIFSIGAGFDYQERAALVYSPGTSVAASSPFYKAKDYLAWTVDLYLDHPISHGTVFTFQFAYVDTTNRTGSTIDASNNFTGVTHEYGYFFEAGLLLFDRIQPVLKYMSWVQEKIFRTAGDTTLGQRDREIDYFVLGANYYINGHNANVKAEYRFPLGKLQNGRNQATQTGESQFLFQAQVYL